MAKKIIFLVLAIAFSAVVVLTSLGTGAAYAEAGGQVGRWVNEYLLASRLNAEETAALSSFGGKFVGHYLLFLATGLFTALFLKEIKMKYAWRACVFVVYGLLLSSLGETIQLFTPGRFPTFGDVILNLTAFLTLPGIYALWKRFYSQRLRATE